MSRDLYLHIGTEKTGTTSIQRFLKSNRELLASNGILFPTSPGNMNHMALTVAAQDEDVQGPLRKIFKVLDPIEVRQFRARLRADMDAELKDARYPKTIMSGEHCSSRLLDDREVERLKGMLTPYFDRIRIIVYIRRQDDFLLSTYSTTIKVGGTRQLGIPAARRMENRYDHWELLSRWARVFGRENIICRKYDKQTLKGESVVTDFLDAAGIEANLPFDQPEMRNESFDAYTLEFLRLFNRHVPRFDGDERNAMRENLVSTLAAQAEGPLPTLPRKQLDEFMSNFTESNRRVAVEYFGGELDGSDDPLFLPRSDSRDRTGTPELTAERAVKIAAYLWQEQQEEIDRLSERVKKLTERLRAGGKPEGRGAGKPGRVGGKPRGPKHGEGRRGKRGQARRQEEQAESADWPADQ
jgi:hypothetical protein